MLLGDAAHTAHYSIGSGTKLAMEDAIELVTALDAAADLPTRALNAYEALRRPAVERLQELARRSQHWWDTFPERLDLPVDRLMVAYMSRAGNVPLARFAQSSPDVVRRALRTTRGRAPEALDAPTRRRGCSTGRCAPGTAPWTPVGWNPGRSRRYGTRTSPVPATSPGCGRRGERLVAGGGCRRRARPAARRRRVRGCLARRPDDRDAVLDRLDLAERIRRATGLLPSPPSPRSTGRTQRPPW